MVSKISENAEEKPMITLELVDDLQRLGISYHFKDEISNMLKTVYNCYYEDQEKWKKLHWNLKALGFRLLRQHGYPIPQEIFEDIKDERGIIKTHIHEDVVGLLNLYEASFLAFEEDDMLDEVREFTSKCLQEKVDQNIIGDENILMLISHALETPLNWRVQRFEALWFMDVYKGRNDMKPLMLEFATLDFNILQAIHQEELKNSSRWWNSLAWDKKTDFIRDRMVESFVWGVSGNYEPAFGDLRMQVTKLTNLVIGLDDLYDTRGTLEELEQFTDVITRWDINAAEGLPYYMKICFVGLFNTTNEMAYEAMKNQGSFVVPYLKKALTQWGDSMLKEVRWFNSGYIPTLEEHLNNSWIAVGLPVMVLIPYYVSVKDIKEEELENVVYLTSTIMRLCNDLATATNETERCNVSNSIQCYMKETGASEEEAMAYLKNLIIKTWKKLNKERMITRSPRAQIIIDYTIDITRNSQFTYLRGDNIGNPDEMYESHALGLFFNPKS